MSCGECNIWLEAGGEAGAAGARASARPSGPRRRRAHTIYLRYLSIIYIYIGTFLIMNLFLSVEITLNL